MEADPNLMKSKKDINIWDPNEIVYKAGDKSVSAYWFLMDQHK